MTEREGIQVVPVDLNNRKQVKEFIKFHYRIYKGDDNWVAPLIIDYLERLNPKKHPYHLHSKVQPFIAYLDGQIAGRITAHENTQHVEYHKEPVGFFGFFECIENQEVAGALFEAAGRWLRDRGLETMRGPASFSVNGDPIALLVDGFNSPPVLGMSYNPAYYEALVESAGFKKSQDFYAYHFDVTKKTADRHRGLAARALRDPKLTIRATKMKNFDKELNDLKFIYNEALSMNWGAVPMTEEEFDHFSGELKLAVDAENTLVAEYDGEPIGLALVFKDMNKALKLAKGRLFPFGLVRILLNRNNVSGCRVPVLGVLEPYRNRGIDVAFYVKSIDIGIEHGYKDAELSWILESNPVMNSILTRLGMVLYKTYRMYDLPLADS